MKAIEILRHLTTFCGVDLHNLCIEAIAELEALQQPKSCEGCKHHIAYITPIGNIESCFIFEKDESLCVRKHRWLDRYEAREQ